MKNRNEARRNRRRCRRARGRLRRCVDIGRRRDLSGRRSGSRLPVREEGDDLSPDGVEEEPVPHDPGLAERREGPPEARRRRPVRVGRLHDVPQDQERRSTVKVKGPAEAARDEARDKLRKCKAKKHEGGKHKGKKKEEAQAQGLGIRRAPPRRGSFFSEVADAIVTRLIAQRRPASSVSSTSQIQVVRPRWRRRRGGGAFADRPEETRVVRLAEPIFRPRLLRRWSQARRAPPRSTRARRRAPGRSAGGRAVVPARGP